jgi:hypothetical protein
VQVLPNEIIRCDPGRFDWSPVLAAITGRSRFD